MPFDNLPQVSQTKIDGNLQFAPVNEDPIVLVIGTAGRGDSETFYTVEKPSDAVSEFGKTGSLIKGMYEVMAGGAKNVRLFRVCATPAVLTGVGRYGTADGYTVTTVMKDGSMGTDYKIFWDDSELRLRVYRASDSTLVYDNSPAAPASAVDLVEVAVTGSAATGSGDVGTLAVPVTLAAADDTYGDGYPAYTAGADNATPSRMELYEGLYDAYELLEADQVDIVVPMNVYLDDLNVMDVNSATSSGVLYSISAYPTAGTSTDYLGKVYVEEYEGENYFWWWFPSQPATGDADTVFTLDGGANIFPSVGSANATRNASGTTLTGSDFHEVNFGYQLANFCYTQSVSETEMWGSIGVKGPASNAVKNVSQWVGSLPTYVESGSNEIVSVNGSGLLGNRWMAGRVASGGVTGVPGHIVNGIDGLRDGGFIATDDGWFDGTEQQDSNDHYIDIGKYLDVVSAQVIVANSSQATSYQTTAAPTYAGFLSTLPPESGSTNKVIRNVSLPFRISKTKLNSLTGLRYVSFQDKDKGIVVVDGRTAARNDSDYRKRSTMTQVKECVDAVREIGEKFIGNSLSATKIAALGTGVERRLDQLQKRGVIQRYESEAVSTPAQRVLGQCSVNLKIVPAFELTTVSVTVALAAV